jgi:hypothetical protein
LADFGPARRRSFSGTELSCVAALGVVVRGVDFATGQAGGCRELEQDEAWQMNSI